MYTLESEQTVDAGIEQTWNFLKNPANLNRITPDDLHFEIISPIPEVMYNGLLIEYRINIPCFGKRKWIAEIKHIREQRSFVDEQRIGPYTFWYHFHEIREVQEGVRIIDRVHYAIPFGLFGRLLHGICIRKTLNRIFVYRKTKLADILCR